MSVFTSEEVKIYTASLNQQVEVLATHQHNVNQTKTLSISNGLIEELYNLRKALPILSKKEWFARYITIYITYFFDPLIKQYTNLILNSYQYLWLEQSSPNQIEFTKVGNDSYNFPNMGIMTTDNFNNLIKKDFLGLTKSGILSNNLSPSDTCKYEQPLGMDVYIYTLTNQSGETFSLTIHVYKALIKVQIITDEIEGSFPAKYLRIMLELICKQQLKAKIDNQNVF